MTPPPGRQSLLSWLGRRAARDRNSFTITIVPSQAERTIQLELPRWAVRLLFGLLLAALVILLLGLVGSSFLLSRYFEYRSAMSELADVRAQSEQVAELEKKVHLLEETRRQLFEIAGVASEAGDSTGAGIWEVAPADTGGVDVADLSDAAADTPLKRAPFRGPISRGFSQEQEQGPDHSGVDIAGQVGSSILAAADGVVAFAGWDETFGNLLILQHRENWETRYGHNDELFVVEGDTVTAGRRIASIGSTGRSSAPHLHFEVVRDGTPVDPAVYFRSYREAVSDSGMENPQ